VQIALWQRILQLNSEVYALCDECLEAKANTNNNTNLSTRAPAIIIEPAAQPVHSETDAPPKAEHKLEKKHIKIKQNVRIPY